jgi:hypothetical protein
MNPLRLSTKLLAVTPSDTVDIVGPCIGFYVGGTGNVVAVNMDDTTALLTAVPAGTIIPSVIKRINTTNTTATAIVAFIG